LTDGYVTHARGTDELFSAVLDRSIPFRFMARGHSMHPFIRDADVIIVSPLGGRRPRVGDVVAFLSSDARLVIHRVVARTSSQRDTAAAYLIRGDNCSKADGRVKPEAVLGVVTRVERAGRPRGFLAGPGAAALAFLSRTGALRFATGCAGLPRRAAGAALRQLQRTQSYRRALRRLGPSFAIEPASPADEAELMRRFGLRADLRPREDDTSVTAFVARVGSEAGRVVGFVELVRRDASDVPFDGAWIHSTMVATPYRGMGIAEMLLQRAIAAARDFGEVELRLSVFADNAPAVGLYRKLGFERDMSPLLAERLESEEHPGGRHLVAFRVSLAQSGADAADKGVPR